MATQQEPVRATNGEAAAGAAIYSRPFLSIYDLIVVRLSNTYAWKCPARLMVDFYNQNVSSRHLDVGVGTGYYLDRCHFPSANPQIRLVDLNPNSLQVTAQRLARYHPVVHAASVLEPLDMNETFDSIALNFLLHCLPGTMNDKSIVFKNLKPLLSPGGTLFGTTILGQAVPHSLLSRTLMRTYNARGIFSNAGDNQADLERNLREQFPDSSVHVVGTVAFFVARK